MGLGGLGWLADIALILMNQFSDGSGALIQRSPSQTNFNNSYHNPFRASGQGTYYEHYSSNFAHSVDGMEGHQFEKFCADLAMPFSVRIIRPRLAIHQSKKSVLERCIISATLVLL